MVSVKEPSLHATEAVATAHATVCLQWRHVRALPGGRPLWLKAASRLEGIGGIRNFKREFLGEFKEL